MSGVADIRVMLVAADKVAPALVRDFGELEKLQVSRKGFKDFVTSADIRTERRLVSELSKSRPGFSFICEESGKTSGEHANSIWIIDPIDGTTNFMRGIPYFAINLALMEMDSITSGLTLDPMRGNYFTATKGSGAFLGRHHRLRVSGREEIRESMISVHTTPEIEASIRRSDAITRRTGSVVLDLAYLAAGKYDAIVATNVGLWDIASGIILLQEAGGFMEYSKTENDKYDFLAASSKIMLSQVSRLIETI
ncbi:MAG: inositol monophosphatase [Holosporales bacterium]|jgi:myo-inositol-1(or 4)-monophosphatase|nr:inositol monophosphatase [Holosporales bacterium]